MKKVLLSMLLLLPVGMVAEKPAPNPADYTLVVHVQSSGIDYEPMGQRLHVLIDGKKYDLANLEHQTVLRVGDYKAKLVREDTKRPFEYTRTYQLLFPNGEIRDFMVVGESE